MREETNIYSLTQYDSHTICIKMNHQSCPFLQYVSSSYVFFQLMTREIFQGGKYIESYWFVGIFILLFKNSFFLSDYNPLQGISSYTFFFVYLFIFPWHTTPSLISQKGDKKKQLIFACFVAKILDLSEKRGQNDWYYVLSLARNECTVV